MEILRKKTFDKTVESLLPEAYSKGIKLPWDRYEQQLPLFGMGKLGLACDLCTEGPCLVNPFDTAMKPTICGREPENMTASYFSRLISNGASCQWTYLRDTDLINKISFNKIPSWIDKRTTDSLKNNGVFPSTVSDEVLRLSRNIAEGSTRPEKVYKSAIRTALAGFFALDEGLDVRDKIAGAPKPQKVGVNLDVLKKDSANVVLCGYLPNFIVKKLMNKAKSSGGRINITGIAGSDGVSPLGISILTNYGSQEVALLTGLVDAVVGGGQCASPGFLSMARQAGITVFCQRDDVDAIIKAAEEHSKSRATRSSVPSYGEEIALIGFDESHFTKKTKKWASLLLKEGIKATGFIGGCNNPKATQDAVIVGQALELLKNDVMVISTGCAAAALAKAGLMNPARQKEFAGKKLALFLKSLSDSAGLRQTLPAALHFGTCYEAPRAIRFIEKLKKEAGAKIIASFPELSRPSSWATAVAVLSLGIPTYFGPDFPLDGTAKGLEIFTKIIDSIGGGKLMRACEIEIKEKALSCLL